MEDMEIPQDTASKSVCHGLTSQATGVPEETLSVLVKYVSLSFTLHPVSRICSQKSASGGRADQSLISVILVESWKLDCG